MATGIKWIREVKKLGLQECINYRDAIQEIMTWDFFADEYRNQGLFEIMDFLTAEIGNKLQESK